MPPLAQELLALALVALVVAWNLHLRHRRRHRGPATGCDTCPKTSPPPASERLEKREGRDRDYEVARERALRRLDRGFDLGGTPPADRSDLHER